ncbi:perlucin-like [Anopheles maculipalpis]|uniref:perlucin-like n=1 Tax=Anopheles maculipalpis TaxID=1496333 RepID=UPI00215957B4|nr:perlucin-like [Anopheles maculipalpis]
MALKYLCLVLCLALFATKAHGYNEYVAYKISATFFEAYQQCRLFGGYLASIDSAAENARAVTAIKAVGDINRQWYIGGSDLGKEGTFVWVGLNKRASYLNFGPSEPNNSNGIENCIAIGSISGTQWNDIPCSFKAPGFVCTYVRQ